MAGVTCGSLVAAASLLKSSINGNHRRLSMFTPSASFISGTVGFAFFSLSFPSELSEGDTIARSERTSLVKAFTSFSNELYRLMRFRICHSETKTYAAANSSITLKTKPNMLRTYTKGISSPPDVVASTASPSAKTTHGNWHTK